MIFVLTILVTTPENNTVAFQKSGFEFWRKRVPVSAVGGTNSSQVSRINDEIAIGILTTAKYHNRLKAALSSWWDLERFPDLVTVWSDSDQNSTAGITIPNLMDSKCDNSYHYGLWCKNAPMIEHWRTDPRFKHTKWFMRIMDDSYVHLENLLHLTDQYDHLDPIVIGDRFCTEHGYDYPSGGPGFLLSKGALNAWDSKAWNYPISVNRPHDQYFDDVVWGEYFHNALPKVHFIHHHGITQNRFYRSSEIFQYYLKFRDESLQWPLDFRVVAVHQHQSDMSMNELHQLLHEIRYEPVANVTVPILECKCPGNRHQRCQFDLSRDTGPCRYENTLRRCISDGPWPHLN